MRPCQALQRPGLRMAGLPNTSTDSGEVGPTEAQLAERHHFRREADNLADILPALLLEKVR